MKKHILKITVLFVALLPACSTLKKDKSGDLQGSHFNLRVENYQKQQHRVGGKLVPLHFLKSEKGWYLALGCALNEKQLHSFEVVDHPITSPQQLDDKVEASQIKESGTFDSLADCQSAFSKLQAASARTPVCLKSAEEGVLVSSCREPAQYRNESTAFGNRF